MVFVKFHNMNRKKKFLMSPLNSNKLKNFHFTTSQNNITITVQKCSVFFSSFFNLCTVYLKKCSFFLFFSYAVFNNVQVSSSSFFSFRLFSILLYVFVFVFTFFLFFFFFFHNKLLIQCPFFFQPYIYLSVFTLTR